MEFLQNIKDSVETSVNIKLFPSLNQSSYYHIFKSNLVTLPLSIFGDVENFNPSRLSSDPYPKGNSPRGQNNLNSVLYHRRIIRKQGYTEPIWIVLKNGKYTLLDGAHRIIATYLENKRTIQTYLITIN